MSQNTEIPVRSYQLDLPLRAGTRASPLALAQTRAFLASLAKSHPSLRVAGALEEHHIKTTGDAVQDRRLAEVGGKGLFAKEIHEALLDDRIDFAVHSLKDLETALPRGVVLACTLTREDARDVLILPPDVELAETLDPLDALPPAALIGTSSVRRQAQLLAARPDLRPTLFRGNVQTRLDRVARGEVYASLLAYAGLKRLGLAHRASVVLSTDVMLPAACQGIVGVTARSTDTELLELLLSMEDPAARAAATAERALLHALNGSCRTPIGGYATMQADGTLRLDGLSASENGRFLLRRSISGAPADAARMGAELGASLKADSPADIFEP